MRLHRSVAQARQYDDRVIRQGTSGTTMTISAFAAGFAASRADDSRFQRRLCAAPLPPRAQLPPPRPRNAPPVTIVQPLCGVEAFSRETLASIFALDYPDYEIVFCLADAADPIAPLVRR